MLLFDVLEQFDILHVLTEFSCCVHLSELYYALFINVLVFAYVKNTEWSYESKHPIITGFSPFTFKQRVSFIIRYLNKFIIKITSELTIAGQPLFLYSFHVSFLTNLFYNVSGMYPSSVTITSQLLITFFLSLANMTEIFVLGFMYNGINFLRLFIPTGVPLFLLPLLVFVDSLSVLSRLFSLAIRLFANILSGHLLIKIVSGFFFVVLSSIPGLTGGLLCFVFLIVIILIICLEIAVSFLQAYVWLVLITIYFESMVVNLH